MIADVFRVTLGNVPEILFVAAFVAALLRRHPEPFAARLLAWLLLLPIGIGYAWAGVFHVAFPQVAAASIGWQVSPFQFEIGVADIAIGVTAIVSFWRSLDFKAAVVWYIVLFNIGVAIGHFRQAFTAGDFAADNFGLLLVTTLAEIVLLPWLLIATRR